MLKLPAPSAKKNFPQFKHIQYLHEQQKKITGYFFSVCSFRDKVFFVITADMLISCHL
jgi:hypothetical protein